MAADSTDSIQNENLLDKNKDDRILNVLVIGKTGVGKSRLVNALVGGNVTEEGVRERLTAYEATIKDVDVKVWDSPGLQDGTSNEDQYVQDMKENIKDIALLIFCVRMDEARFYDPDKKAIRTLTDEFGKEVWNHAVVALTFANKVEDPDGEDELQYFQYQLQEWKKQLRKYFAAVGVDPKVRVPAIPAGFNVKKTSLPGREDWLSDLRIECSRVMKQRLSRSNQFQWSRPWTWPWTVVTYVSDLFDTLWRKLNI